MKRGFTLVELLAVIVLIAVISIIGIVGVTKVRNNIKSDMCRSTIDLITKGAIHYGEDNHNQLTKSYNENGVSCSNNCLKLTVQDLINDGYINVKQIAKKDENGNYVKDSEGKIIYLPQEIINDFNDEILNNKFVYIYDDNDIIYASLENSVKCN